VGQLARAAAAADRDGVVGGRDSVAAELAYTRTIIIIAVPVKRKHTDDQRIGLCVIVNIVCLFDELGFSPIAFGRSWDQEDSLGAVHIGFQMIDFGQPLAFGRGGIARAPVTFNRDIIHTVGNAKITVGPKTATDRKHGLRAREIGVHLGNFSFNGG